MGHFVHGFDGNWPRQSHRGLMAPTHKQSCAVERGHINRNGMKKMGMHKAYLVHASAWATIAPSSLLSLHLPRVSVVVINTLEWYGEGGIRFRSPAPPLPHSYSCMLVASSSPIEMDVASVYERSHRRLTGHRQVSEPACVSKGKFLSNVLRL